MCIALRRMRNAVEQCRADPAAKPDGHKNGNKMLAAIVKIHGMLAVLGVLQAPKLMIIDYQKWGTHGKTSKINYYGICKRKTIRGKKLLPAFAQVARLARNQHWNQDSPA